MPKPSESKTLARLRLLEARPSPVRAIVEADMDAALRGDVPLETIEELIEQANSAYEEFGRRTVTAAIRIGELLVLAKAKVAHNEWYPWLNDHTRYSPRSASRFMDLAANRTNLADLPDGASVNQALVSLADDRKRTREEQAARDREAQISRAKAKARGPQTIVVPQLPAPGEQLVMPNGFVLKEADAADVAKPTGGIDLQLFSPPYNLGVRYFDGIRDDYPYEEYLEKVDGWCREAYRVAAPQGRICVNVPIDVMQKVGKVNVPKPIMADWLGALEAAGWTYRHTILWTKGGAGHTVGHVARGTEGPDAAHVFAGIEAILVMHKGEWNLKRRGAHDLEHEEWLQWTDGYWRDVSSPVWDDILPARREAGGAVPWPRAVARRLIKLYSYPGALVMDQFMGEGTTAIEAAQAGRRFIGSDLSPTSVQLARKRLDTLVRSQTSTPSS